VKACKQKDDSVPLSALLPQEQKPLAALSAAWDALPIAEKHLYISEVTVCVIIISVLLYTFAFTVR
jgi:hypothetical protein